MRLPKEKGEPMQYNFHNEKYKISDVGGIHREQFREYTDPERYKNEVDSTRTQNNVYIELTENGKDWFAHIRDAKESTSEITGRAVRKDAVVLCSTVESVPPTWDNSICREYFYEKARWYEKYLQEKGGVDKDCMLSVCIHLDESTPHATYVWIPAKDGKLQAKNILDRNFLKSLQTDSQQFTFDWIRQYEEKNTLSLEKLDPIECGSQRQHLLEAEYKKEQIRTQVEELQQQHQEVQQQINEANDELVRKTQAPDLKSYEEVVTENKCLKEELSWKDKLIEKLQEEKIALQATVERLTEKVQKLSDNFADLAHKAGQKLMKAFGYDVSRDISIQEFPLSDIKNAMSEMKEEVEKYDPTTLRVIPDRENPGTFQVVSRKQNGDYEMVREGFSTRDEADDFRRSMGHAAESLTDKFEEKMSESLKIK